MLQTGCGARHTPYAVGAGRLFAVVNRLVCGDAHLPTCTFSAVLYNGYRVFPGGKVRPGRAADHSPPSSADVLEE